MDNLSAKHIASLIFINILIFIAIGEMVCRTFGVTTVYEYDKVLGWAPKSNFKASIAVKDQSGTEYTVDYSTNEFGFREFGSLGTHRKKILFIGDSFTGDPNTSDSEAYFGIVKDTISAEVFALGAGGYGTLQELLLIKKYAQLIRPDILVLQFCGNDLINNSMSLEGGLIVRNQKNLRPYLVENNIRYRLPHDSLYVFLYRNSRLFRSLDALLTTLQFNIYGSYSPPEYHAYEGLISAESPEQQAEIAALWAESVSVTKSLMLELKRAMPPGTALLTFPATANDPKELQIWQTLAEETGFTAYPSVATKVEEAEKSGKIVRVHDGAHWNRLGNRIAGEELANIINRDFLSVGQVSAKN